MTRFPHLLAILALCFSSLAHARKAPDPIISLEQSFTKWIQQYDNVKPAQQQGPLAGNDRIHALSYLSYLVTLEDILLRLREDDKTRQAQLETEALSNADKKRILSLRINALKERITLLAGSEKRRRAAKAEAKLHKFFDSKSKRALTQIRKAEKAIERIIERGSSNEREESKQEKLLAEGKKNLAEIRLAFYGPTIKGFEAPFVSTNPGKAEDLLQKVVIARDSVLKALRISQAQAAGGGEEKEGVIAGIKVKSQNLGVILDNSSSMTPYLQPLREEITEDFAEAHFREAYGCALHFPLKGLDVGKREQVLLYMEDLIIAQKADAIYWFSDLNDPIMSAALQRLSWLRGRSPASLYVLSVDKAPSKELMKQVTSFKKHKVR